MWLHTLLASLKSGHLRSRLPQPRPTPRSPRLVLEQFEDRSLPSSYSAATVPALIADITASNAAGGANTIILTAPTTSPYVLTAVNNGGTVQLGNVTAANGLPVIAANDNLTIVGNGDTIERTTGSVVFRLIDVASQASLTLQNLTLQGGLVQTGWLVLHEYYNYYGAAGGAIYNQGALTLSGVTLVNNSAISTAGGPGAGGAIWSSGSLTLENGTLLEGNLARGGEGLTSPEGTLLVPGAAFGGAVYVAGGNANISNTTFTGKNIAYGGNLDNQVEYGFNSYGGALYVASGHVALTNDTVTNNWTQASGEGAKGYGAGIYFASGTVTLTGDTVESNIFDEAGYGGGIFIASGATVSIDPFSVANTINNTDSSGLNGSTANIDGIYIET